MFSKHYLLKNKTIKIVMDLLVIMGTVFVLLETIMVSVGMRDSPF